MRPTKTCYRFRILAAVFCLLLAGAASFSCRMVPAPEQKPLSPAYTSLKQRLQEYTAAQEAVYGIYFRDLNTGASFGINADKPLKAASLNKLPTVLYLNRLVADGKLKMSDRVTYEKEKDYNPQGGILQTDGIDGQSYSLRLLANLSITLSDNTAHSMLLRFLGKDRVADFMTGLGGKTIYPDGENVMTARDMGTYLQAVLDFAREEPALGNRLLDDLKNTIWDFGLPGRLPDTIAVAHKEGQTRGVNNDAGIVYGRRPFILVVLSDGIVDSDQGFARIAEITRMVYDFQEELAGREPSNT